MKLKKFHVLAVILLFTAAPSVLAIIAGVNPDIHMDIPGAIANDFHMQGRIKSGFIGGNWSMPPTLVGHVDGGFPDFSYSITPDLSSPGQNEFFFRADWKGREFVYCNVLHLGVFFDLACHNLIIDLVGWWTFNGQRISAGQNGGTILIPGFEVTDFQDGEAQRIQIRNDSQLAGPAIAGRIVSLDLITLKQEQVSKEFGSLEELFYELRTGGRQEQLQWIPILYKEQLISREVPYEFAADSFFDVFFELDIPNQNALSPATALQLEPGDILISRVLTAFPDNSGQVDYRWTWHMHESHHLDFGDAPRQYPVLLAANGARHIIRGPWLGDSGDRPDREQDGLPDPAALGDDNLNFDDEDGVSISLLTPGQPAIITFQVSGGGGYVDGWIDFNRDFTWQNPPERVVGSFYPSGTHSVNINVPPDSSAGVSFARFRISSRGNLTPVGQYNDGEVEDHRVEIAKLPEPKLDFGDAPDTPRTAGYATLLVNNGARHQLGSGLFLGTRIPPDAEPDGQPDANALGDDTNGSDDEDGVVFITTPLIPGQTAQLEVSLSQDGLLSAWLDFDCDGNWAQTGDKIFSNLPLPAGITPLAFPVPLTAVPGRTYARFRVSINGGLSYNGQAPDGEVEDYLLEIGKNKEIKWLQRPDVTPAGIDIRLDSGDGHRRVLADDFLCTRSGPITDLHFWGSWKNDRIGKIERIHLSFHSDDPSGQGGSDPDNRYSKPDKLLWEKDFFSGDFSEKEYTILEKEGEFWWDPLSGEWLASGEHTIRQIDLRINPREAFRQQGTSENPLIYWLDIAVDTFEGEFGWKTRRRPDHYNDDAVFAVKGEDWKELKYPSGHPYGPLFFEDLTSGSEYNVGDSFLTSGIEVRLLPFEWSNGQITGNGFAGVDIDGIAGGSGNELFLNNVNLDFTFTGRSQLDLLFADLGGNENIRINGEFKNVNSLDELDGSLLGGVRIDIEHDPAVPGSEQGLLRLEGDIHQFSIGGQELWIDNVEGASIDMAFALTMQLICGDVNYDGIVNIVDALYIARCGVGLLPCPALEIADVNCDGRINIVDALMVARYGVGLISSLNCCP